MDFFIEKTIHALKQRLQENNGIIRIQCPEGNLSHGTCTFFDPINENDITLFEQELGYKLPGDYKRFLLLTNGCY